MLRTQGSGAASMAPVQDRTQEIKNELALLNHTLKMSVQKAIRVGELLTEQKAFVGHGNFLSWLEKNIDMSERTAQRYMALFSYRSKTANLSDLSTAYHQIETLEAQAKLSEEERQRSIISEYRRTGVKPAGWTPEIEESVKKTDEHLAKIKAEREKEEAERERRSNRERQAPPKPSTTRAELPPDDVDYYYRLGKSVEEQLKSASTAITTHTTARQTWKEKIRLSAGGKEDPFIDAIMDYLDTLPDDNRRIEACNNIIKIARNIAVELQGKVSRAAN